MKSALARLVLAAALALPGCGSDNPNGPSTLMIGTPFSFRLPPSLGYGNQAVGPIPANSTLIFEVTLPSVAGK